MKMKRLMLAVLFLGAGWSAQTFAKGFDAVLTEYSYPFPVLKHNFESQKNSMSMVYMDVPAADAKQKEVILLLHGKNFNGAYFEDIANTLSKKGYRVIIPDQIGFGKSTKPKSYQYSIHGLKNTTPYVYWPIEQVLGWYQSPPNPFIFIRCQSLATYLDAHPNIPHFYLETLAEITAYEKDIEQFVMKGIPMDEQRERDITPIAQKYLSSLEIFKDELTTMSQEERTFIQGVIRERLQSIAGQWNYANKSYLLVELGAMFGRLP